LQLFACSQEDKEEQAEKREAFVPSKPSLTIFSTE